MKPAGSLLITLFLFSFFPGAATGEPSLPPVEKVNRIERAIDYLQERLSEEETAGEVISRLRDSFPETEEFLEPWENWRKRAEGPAEEDRSVVLEALRDRLTAARTNLAAVSERAATFTPGEEAVARERLNNVLRRKEFARLGGGETWLSRLSRRIEEMIGGILRRLISEERFPRLFLIAGRFVWWALAIIALGILIRFLRPHLLSPVVRGGDLSSEFSRTFLLDDPSELEKEAGRLYSEGKFRQSLRLYYLALIAALERKDLLDHDRSLTNWEYRRQLARKNVSPALIDLFSRLSDIYDKKWYGEETCLPGDLIPFRAGLLSVEAPAP